MAIIVLLFFALQSLGCKNRGSRTAGGRARGMWGSLRCLLPERLRRAVGRHGREE
jgi:hypothetical protein